MDIKELRQNRRKKIIEGAIDKHCFLGLVTKKTYRQLLEFSLQQADRNIDLFDELLTTKAKLFFCEEELRTTKNSLENHQKTFTMFDWLLANGEDIRFEEFVYCLLEQMPSDMELYNALNEIYKESLEEEKCLKWGLFIGLR